VGGEVLEDVLALAVIEGNIEVSPAGVELHDNLLPARGWVVDALEAVYEQCVHPLPDWLRLCHCIRCTATTTCSSAYTSQTNTTSRQNQGETTENAYTIVLWCSSSDYCRY
jgi:hypothetical protein